MTIQIIEKSHLFKAFGKARKMTGIVCVNIFVNIIGQ